MDCAEVTLWPGDVLYLPRGTVHFATTDAEEGSTHMTYQLMTDSSSWLARVTSACARLQAPALCQSMQARLLGHSEAHLLLFLASDATEGRVRRGVAESLQGHTWMDAAAVGQLLAAAKEGVDSSSSSSRALQRNVRVEDAF